MRSTNIVRSGALAAVALSAGFALTLPATPALAATVTPAAAKPKVTKVSPSSGVAAFGNQKVTITGSGFKKVISVKFGKTKAKSVKVVSSNVITVVTPKLKAGTYKVTVKTKYGTRSGGSYKARSYASEVARLVNVARSSARKCGATNYPAVPALKWNSKLAKAAKNHSTDMAKKKYFGHYSKNGRSPWDRIKATGYKYSWAGENIAAGYSTPAKVMAGWLASEGHCKNIMNANFREIGVGYAKGGPYGRYWTQDFGTQA